MSNAPEQISPPEDDRSVCAVSQVRTRIPPAFWSCLGLLIAVDLLMVFRGFAALRSFAARVKPLHRGESQSFSVWEICRAMDYACIFYWKPVLCLQRSTATAIILKRYGYSATVVIGAQVLPMRSHAWVEVGSEIVNDKAYVASRYKILERF